MGIKILSGHYTPETAYLVADYPYGFRMRCRIRYWLEVNDKGTRMWSQTSNPKKEVVIQGAEGCEDRERWNKPKASTYSIVGAMYLDEDTHVHWSGLSIYNIREAAKDFLATYREGLTVEQVAFCERITAPDARIFVDKL
jgi:hypothetical protein